MEEAGPRFSAVSLLADGGPVVPLLSLRFLVSQSAVPILVWGAVPLPRIPFVHLPFQGNRIVLVGQQSRAWRS